MNRRDKIDTQLQLVQLTRNKDKYMNPIVDVNLLGNMCCSVSIIDWLMF